MGYYINPRDMSKEDFLYQNGHVIHTHHINDVLSGKLFDGLCLPVCLVNNGAFTAAAIAYDKAEATAFQGKEDVRPKTWFAVPKEQLRPYLGESFFDQRV